MHTLILLLATFFYCIIIDLIWLGFFAKDLYDENIGFLLRKTNGILTPNWSAATVVYIAISVGLVYFVLPKANGNYLHALCWGALFGAVMYGIYEFTNLAILANWPITITLIDVLWGTIMCGSASVFANFIKNWLRV